MKVWVPLTKTSYLKNRLLKGAPVWEAEGPWPLDLCDFVHGVQVQTGVLLRLATWQEVDATQGRHDSAAEGPEKKSNMQSIFFPVASGDKEDAISIT